MATKMLKDAAKTILIFGSLLFQSSPPPEHSRDFALAAFEPSNPTAECLKHKYIDEAVACFDRFTVDWDVYTQETYDKAQPTPEERSAWLSTITALLDVQGDCHAVQVPDALKGIYTISEKDSFCVLSEVKGNGTQYDKGWGLFVTPLFSTDVWHNIHLAAPLPGYDLGTPEQAVALFVTTAAKSLFIPGRSKFAFKKVTDCVPSTEKSTYYVTDPLHNKVEPFYDATRSIYEWQINKKGGCPPESCAFIHLHGKSASTCSKDQIFLSSGLGRNTWYQGAPHPVNRLKAELQRAFPNETISLPTDSSCSLAATKDVVGRFLNGVSDGDVCTSNADPAFVKGVFISAEQAPDLRKSEAYSGWADALNGAFEAVRR